VRRTSINRTANNIMTTPQAHIQSLIDDLVTAGPEAGLQVAAYHKGRLVVDAWAGADTLKHKPVDGDTLFVTFSTTKGITATVIHLLAERGLIDYDAPVAKYWPAFAKHGKDAITVRQIMAHTAGVPHLPLDTQPEDVADWRKQVRWMEEAAPLWEPGAQTGYHALTIGIILGELAERVDGRPIAQIVREDLCAPLGIDTLFFGAPAEAMDRIAMMDIVFNPDIPMPPADALVWRAIPASLQPLSMMANRDDFRRAVAPAANMVANARALAKFYASLVGDGVDGVRLLSKERVRIATEMQTDATDCVIGGAWPKGMGYFLGSATAPQTCVSPTAFGHTGAGGFTAYADPAHDLAFALCKTRMVDEPQEDRMAARIFERELYKVLGG
jgi:CubicO group peptidase (beta-lactamase class C family)